MNRPLIFRHALPMWLILLLRVTAITTGQQVSDEPRTSYRVQIWVATDDSPEVAHVCGQQFPTTLLRQVEGLVGGSWTVAIEAAPRELRQADVAAELTHQRLLALQPELLQLDKLFLLHVGWNGAAFRLQAREYDTRVRQWNVSAQINVNRADDVVEQAVVVLVNAFSPIGTIGRAHRGEVEVRMHAASYADGQDSLLLPGPNALLQVIIRRRRHASGGGEYSFSTVPWTVLRVIDIQLGVTRCEIHSGLRSPLRVRGVSATNRLAIQVKPKHAQTVLHVHTLGHQDQPLTGYEVYARRPSSKSSEYVGQTDWRGEIVLPRRSTAPLQTYYVKHGKQVLARLPIVAGFRERLAIAIVDDEQRLRAEGALQGVQDRLVDTFARREIHAARIRQQLDVSDLTEDNIQRARQQLQLFRELPGRNDFVREMRLLQRDYVGTDATTQNRIDRLFRDARDIMTRKLDPALEQSLAAQIADAEQRLKSLRDYQAGEAAQASKDPGILKPRPDEDRPPQPDRSRS